MIELLIFLGSFAAYLFSLSGTIPAYRDSGDLINAISTLGIAHPPGYPFYTVIGNLFTQLFPWGNPAYRVSAFSALSAALSALLLYRLLISALKQESSGASFTSFASAAIAVVLFVISPAVVSLARVGEMYTLAGCVAAGIMTCAYLQTPQSLLLGSFLLGCGMGVHPILLFLAPLLIPGPDGEQKYFSPAWFRTALQRIGSYLLGFTCVLFLWVRAHTGPVQNWGDPRTLVSVWRMLTRSYYGGLKLHPVESEFSWTPQSIATQLAYFVQTSWQQWGWLALVAGCIGLLQSLRRSGRLLFCWVLAGPFFFVLSNLPIKENTTAPILEPYLVLVNLIWAVWVAQGFYAILQRIRPVATQGLVALLLLAVPLWAEKKAWVSFRQDYYAYDLGRNMLRSLPSGGVMYDPDDQIAFTLRMLQLTEQRRPDVVLLNFFRTYWGYRQILQRWPDLIPPVPIQNAQELEQLFWRYSLPRRPFYSDLPVKIPTPLSYQVNGLLYRMLTQAKPATPDGLKLADDAFALYAWRGSWRTTDHADFFTQHIFNYYAAARCNLGLKYAELKDWPEALRHYRQALCIDPHLAAAYNNLGVMYFEQRRYPQAIENYRLALENEPTNQAYRQNLALAQANLQSQNPAPNP